MKKSNFLVLLLCIFGAVLSRGIWKKRKTSEDEDKFSIPEIKHPSLNSLQRKQAASSSEDSFAILDKLIDDIEVFVDSPQFFEYVTPDTVDMMKQQFMQLPNSDEIMKVMDSPQFQDPAILKLTVKTGLDVIRKYLVEMKSVLADPEQLEAALQSIPSEYRPFVDQVLKGDISGLQGMLSSLPGMTPTNKALLESMMNGDTSTASNMVKDLFKDNSQTTIARKQLLEHPEMAEAFGISREALLDDQKWNDLIADSLSAFEGLDDTADDDSLDSKLFPKARAM
jgi:hypothetical protein